jgi:hypothetical protein
MTALGLKWHDIGIEADTGTQFFRDRRIISHRTSKFGGGRHSIVPPASTFVANPPGARAYAGAPTTFSTGTCAGADAGAEKELMMYEYVS